VADPAAVHGRVRGGGVRAFVGERDDERVGQQHHLHVPGDERLGERVVLLLGAVDPRDAVEQQLVVVARSEPFEFGAGPVQHHRPQRPDLAVDPGSRLFERGEIRCGVSCHGPSVISR
jgi:hypothetical protein